MDVPDIPLDIRPRKGPLAFISMLIANYVFIIFKIILYLLLLFACFLLSLFFLFFVFCLGEGMLIA